MLMGIEIAGIPGHELKAVIESRGRLERVGQLPFILAPQLRRMIGRFFG